MTTTGDGFISQLTILVSIKLFLPKCSKCHEATALPLLLQVHIVPSVHRTEICQESGVRSQESGVRSQESGVWSHLSSSAPAANTGDSASMLAASSLQEPGSANIPKCSLDSFPPNYSRSSLLPNVSPDSFPPNYSPGSVQPNYSLGFFPTFLPYVPSHLLKASLAPSTLTQDTESFPGVTGEEDSHNID